MKKKWTRKVTHSSWWYASLLLLVFSDTRATFPCQCICFTSIMSLCIASVWSFLISNLLSNSDFRLIWITLSHLVIPPLKYYDEDDFKGEILSPSAHMIFFGAITFFWRILIGKIHVSMSTSVTNLLDVPLPPAMLLRTENRKLVQHFFPLTILVVWELVTPEFALLASQRSCKSKRKINVAKSFVFLIWTFLMFYSFISLLWRVIVSFWVLVGYLIPFTFSIEHYREFSLYKVLCQLSVYGWVVT